LGHDSSKGQVPCCEDNGETYSQCVNAHFFALYLRLDSRKLA
jgi:hypothetical protein